MICVQSLSASGFINLGSQLTFLNVRLHPDDRDYTRFFWLSDPTDPSSQFRIYRFKVVPFGATSSPFILNAVLHHHLKQHNTTVSRDMQINLYVDNIITGCDSCRLLQGSTSHYV